MTKEELKNIRKGDKIKTYNGIFTFVKFGNTWITGSERPKIPIALVDHPNGYVALSSIISYESSITDLI